MNKRKGRLIKVRVGGIFESLQNRGEKVKGQKIAHNCKAWTGQKKERFYKERKT